MPPRWRLNQPQNQRRGSELEQHIERVLKQLQGLPWCFPLRLHIKQARLRDRFVYCDKQPCDYLIITPAGAWGFDAKECAADRWYPSKAPEHQRRELHKLQDMGHRAAFVVWFKRHRGHPDAIRWIEDFSKPATMGSGVRFEWDMFLWGTEECNEEEN